MLSLTLFVLAEGTNIDPSAVVSGISLVTSTGFAIWYAYHTTVHTIPTMLKDQVAERKEMADRFDKALTGVVDELKAVRSEKTRSIIKRIHDEEDGSSS